MNSPCSGVLQLLPQGGGFLRQPSESFRPARGDAWVSIQLMKEAGLVEGAFVQGKSEHGDRGLKLTEVDTVNGLPPEKFIKRKRFDALKVIHPEKRIDLGSSDDVSMRFIDLIAPVGWGTRALIVAAPRTGKTTILESFARSIRGADADARIIALLIDERPEEVTQFRRHVDAEVLASSLDEGSDSHRRLVELTLAQIRCELECGNNAVVLVDSLTRMARAFNQSDEMRSGRTLSGGVDARALEIPRQFFGMARNIEGGGSVTVLATALIDTGSRMDEYVFQEFKGTGNCEIVLDRDLADQRIFPAIDIRASGTRKEELFYSDEAMERLARLRRTLLTADVKQAAEGLIRLVRSTPDNQTLLNTDLSSDLTGFSRP